jgi:hypothetical protein
MRKLTIEEMHQLAKALGVKCLADKYVGARTPIPWKCGKGHRWEALPYDVKRRGCLECGKMRRVEARSKLGIEEMHRIAKERDGRCLSDTYVNTKTKLLWECIEGHQWDAIPGSIKRGSWCPHCAGNIKSTIKEMRLLAESRDGKCLSSRFVNAHEKLLWECANEHTWKARPHHVRNGSWCPECSSGLGERICREFFEQIFEKEFPRSFPEWLVNNKGNQMELDGYCQSLGLAFEHHGEQHYTTKTKFIKSERILRERQEDDEIRRKLCTRQGIVLIELPEIPARLPLEEIRSFIRKECERNGISLPDDFDTKKIDLRNAYATSGSMDALKELQLIARNRGGKCLSDNYVNARTELPWECAEGHTWKATPDNIKRGRWCPTCGRKEGGEARRLSIEQMHQIAKERGGECLSDTYVNNQTKLWWKCAEGYRWEAIPMSIGRGSWCPHCAGNIKKTIKDMRLFADSMGGKCLSALYINAHHKLEWECVKGHRWEAPYNKAKHRWCPECAHIRKKSTIAGKTGQP